MIDEELALFYVWDGWGFWVGCWLLAGSFSFAKQAKMRKSLNGIRGPFVGMNPRVLKKLKQKRHHHNKRDNSRYSADPAASVDCHRAQKGEG